MDNNKETIKDKKIAKLENKIKEMKEVIDGLIRERKGVKDMLKVIQKHIGVIDDEIDDYQRGRK